MLRKKWLKAALWLAAGLFVLVVGCRVADDLTRTRGEVKITVREVEAGPEPDAAPWPDGE
jgi:hypothetical protein